MKLADRIERMVHPVHTLPQEIDSFLEHLFGTSEKTGERVFVPRTNLVEREKDFVVAVELPGVQVDDVTVEACDSRLMISGQKRPAAIGESDTVRRKECVTGKFERSFEFQTQVDFDKIQADYEHGVLTLTVPKSEKVLPRKIEINVSQ